MLNKCIPSPHASQQEKRTLSFSHPALCSEFVNDPVNYIKSQSVSFRKVLNIFLLFGQEKNALYPSMPKIAKVSRTSVRTVHRVKKVLADSGLITWERRAYTSNWYTLSSVFWNPYIIQNLSHLLSALENFDEGKIASDLTQAQILELNDYKKQNGNVVKEKSFINSYISYCKRDGFAKPKNNWTSVNQILKSTFLDNNMSDNGKYDKKRLQIAIPNDIISKEPIGSSYPKTDLSQIFPNHVIQDPQTSFLKQERLYASDNLERIELLKKIKRWIENENAAFQSYENYPTQDNYRFYESTKKYREKADQKLKDFDAIQKLPFKKAEFYERE